MDKEKQARLNFLQNDPDTGLIQQGHVCKHGVRWPHECRECVDAAWERHKLEEELKMKENIEFNGSEKIDNAAGDYIVLTDHGMEGISVSYQTDTPQDAINWITGHNYGSPMTLVKLVRMETKEV